MKTLLRIALVLLALGLPAWYALVQYSPPPNHDYALDLPRIRALAQSLPGDKPTELRYEHVMDFRFAEAMVMAGAPWRWTPIPVMAWQLVYPDKTVIVDTAMNRELAKPDFLVPMYDDTAYAHLQAAMEKASLIVLTHEHMDHIGGLAAHPHLTQLLPALRLTDEQLDNPKGMAPAALPAAAMQGYQPLRYDGMMALAPGVVLIKSPGHTPGSQIVYVQRADGRELLLLGDVSWQMRNIEQVRERPLFMTAMIGENRQQVLGEFAALHALTQSAPEVKLVPGHDGDTVRALTAQGLMTPGFKL
ncbi:MAG: MBL fold metallo-hydrolase [Nevskiaceae bacterium]|nr:MAG: MBL fold metallo-hydrolase [Nevskiaceae bacterium]